MDEKVTENPRAGESVFSESGTSNCPTQSGILFDGGEVQSIRSGLANGPRFRPARRIFFFARERDHLH